MLPPCSVCCVLVLASIRHHYDCYEHSLCYKSPSSRGYNFKSGRLIGQDYLPPPTRSNRCDVISGGHLGRTPLSLDSWMFVRACVIRRKRPSNATPDIALLWFSFHSSLTRKGMVLGTNDPRSMKVDVCGQGFVVAMGMYGCTLIRQIRTLSMALRTIVYGTKKQSIHLFDFPSISSSR